MKYASPNQECFSLPGAKHFTGDRWLMADAENLVAIRLYTVNMSL
jgi:hypothetical protein